MSPRRYDMSRKQAAAAETRRRIVEATLKLHGENGIFGTSWADIAREADVATGTVYRHFPTLDELVPACGELLMERTRPPGPDDIGAILDGATDPAERLHRVAAALFAFYERGGKYLESDLRERQLRPVREWEDFLRAMIEGFVLEALRDVAAPDETKKRLCFLFDVPTFGAIRMRGLDRDEAAAMAAGLATKWLAI